MCCAVAGVHLQHDSHAHTKIKEMCGMQVNQLEMEILANEMIFGMTCILLD